MAVEQAAPGRFGAWREGSTPGSVAVASTGAASLALVVAGSLALIVSRGATPVDRLVATLRSGELKTLLAVGIAGGAGAAVAGWVSYRVMRTKASREQAIGGAVLGAQAAVLGAALLWFVGGDVRKFATNFLDFEALGPHTDTFLRGAKNTIVLAFGGETIGIVLGLVLAVFAISKRAVVRAPARVYINVFRGTPMIWQLSFMYFALVLGFGLNLSTYRAATIAFGLNAGAYSAEVFRAGIQSIERGQLEAARGLGMTYLQAMRHAILPQAVRRVIPPLMNEFVILIKDTSLIVVLGLAPFERELFAVGRGLYSDSFNATFFLATAAGYLVVCIPLIRLVTAVERRLRSGLVGVVGQAPAQA